METPVFSGYAARFLRNTRRVLAPKGNNNNTPATIVVGWEPDRHPWF